MLFQENIHNGMQERTNSQKNCQNLAKLKVNNRFKNQFSCSYISLCILVLHF